MRSKTQSLKAIIILLYAMYPIHNNSKTKIIVIALLWSTTLTSRSNSIFKSNTLHLFRNTKPNRFVTGRFANRVDHWSDRTTLTLPNGTHTRHTHASGCCTLREIVVTPLNRYLRNVLYWKKFVKQLVSCLRRKAFA